MTVRKVAFPIYLLAFSIVVTIAVAGFVLYTDRQNDRKLAELTVDRQRSVNQTLRAMCDRFELRDEIFLRILVDVAQRRRASGDLEGAEEMEFNILALQLAQGDCVQEIPKVLPPLSVP
jgi:hypothetical protein